MWRVYLLAALIAAVVAAAVSFTVVQLGGTLRLAPSSLIVAEGEVEVPFAKSDKEPSEVDVFYKAPFASTPNLTFPDHRLSMYRCQVVDQKATGFKITRMEAFGSNAKLKWVAEGTSSR
jgi:hypothetical protein